MLIMTISMLLGLLALSVTAAATVGLLGMSLAGVYSPLKLTNAIGELAWGTSPRPSASSAASPDWASSTRKLSSSSISSSASAWSRWSSTTNSSGGGARTLG